MFLCGFILRNSVLPRLMVWTLGPSWNELLIYPILKISHSVLLINLR